jgi:hypothetical protein
MKVRRQSDPILRLLDSSQAVEDSVTRQGLPIVAPILEQRFSPHDSVLIADGETEDGQPVFRVVLVKLRDELAASREGLAAAEERHIRLKRRVTKLSNERVQRFDELADDYTWLRGKLERQVGSLDTDALAGFQAPTATKSTGLLRQVELAADALSEAGLTLPKDRLEAFRFDPQETAGKLRDKSEGYRGLLRRLRDLKRDLEVSQKEKDRIVERHKRTFFPIARTMEDFYRLAGEDELAEKVRPSVAQRGRRAIEVEESPEGGAETEAEAPADGASAAGEPSPSAVKASAPAEDAGSEVSPPAVEESAPEAAAPSPRDAAPPEA